MIDFKRATEAILEVSKEQTTEEHQEDCNIVDNQMTDRMIQILLATIVIENPTVAAHIVGHMILLSYRLGVEHAKIDAVISEMEKRNAQ